jgi:hypothetical protein
MLSFLKGGGDIYTLDHGKMSGDELPNVAKAASYFNGQVQPTLPVPNATLLNPSMCRQSSRSATSLSTVVGRPGSSPMGQRDDVDPKVHPAGPTSFRGVAGSKSGEHMSTLRRERTRSTQPTHISLGSS